MGHRVRIDFALLTAVFFLMGLGIVLVYSSSWAIAEKQYHDSYFFLKRQTLFSIMGVIAFGVGSFIDASFYQKHSNRILVFTLVLLILVLIPGIGPKIGLARRWISIGPFHLQSGEISKLAVIIFIAASIANKKEKMKDFSIGFVYHAIVLSVVLLLLLAEPDFGTSVLVATLSGAMLFVGGVPFFYLLMSFALTLPIGVYLIASSAYRRRRILAFLDPWGHRFDVGYQVTESLMAFGSGQWTGLGLGASRQKLFYLPASHTDFIFAILGEELGFIGVFLTLSAFVVIFYKGVRTGISHPNIFKSMLALGIVFSLFLQLIFNVSVVLAIVPTKGITFPFLSYGGSSLLITLFMCGILLRLSGEVLAKEDRI